MLKLIYLLVMIVIRYQNEGIFSFFTPGLVVEVHVFKEPIQNIRMQSR